MALWKKPNPEYPQTDHEFREEFKRLCQLRLGIKSRLNTPGERKQWAEMLTKNNSDFDCLLDSFLSWREISELNRAL